MKNITIIEQQSGNQFTLYDNRLGTILREFEGFEYPQVRESIDDVSGPYGSVYVNSKFGKRQCTIEGDLVGSQIYTNRQLLLRALRQTGTIKLVKFTTYDDVLLQFEAEVTKFINPYTHRIHNFQIELVAPDWRFYSQTLKEYDIGQTLIKGGASIPAEIPMSIASPSGSSGALMNILENIGNEQTDPVFTISGPGTGFYIGNVTNGKNFTLSSTLVEGDEVAIDVKARTVVKNGVTNLYGDITGDFWSIEPGQNEIRFLIDSGLQLGITSLHIEFRDAYNGI